MQRKRAKKRQVTYRLDTGLLECIEALRAVYPRFTATDIVDLMLKGFLARHDIGTKAGAEQLDRAVGQYLRGDFDRTLAVFRQLHARLAEASESPDPEDK